MTKPNWTIYPDDVPSPSGPKQRKAGARIALACCIAAVIALWAGVALAQERDSAGRYILHGTAHVHPAPHHSGGGPTRAAARYFLRISDRGPFRVSGRWFSAGTMVLALVAGPDAMEGSCLDPQVIMSVHRPIAGDWHRAYAAAFLPAFGQSLMRQFESGEITYLRERHYTAFELLGEGYPVCED